MRDKIFISYSHADDLYKSRLETHLLALQRYFGITIWSDSLIEAGLDWNSTIAHIIEETSVAIHLISKDYLASEYIARNEVAPIMSAYNKGEISVIPIILTPCLFHQIQELSQLQAINDPKKPLCNLTELEQDEVWVHTVEAALHEWKKRKPANPTEDTSNWPEQWTEEEKNLILEGLAAFQGFLIPYKEEWYHATIVAQRRNIRNEFRCYQLDKLIYRPDSKPVEGETHWLFYKAGEFSDLKIGDRVRFQVNKINELRHWSDIQNTRNIYISELFVDAKQY